MRAAALWGVLVTLVLAGCTAAGEEGSAPTPTPTEGPAPVADLGAPGCMPASPISRTEVTGTPTEDGTSLAGLVMSATGDVTLGGEVKLVFRLTGEGDLVVELFDGEGNAVPLDWGPASHGSSSFDRPGREWGIGFTTPSPGCWEVRVATDTSGGSFWFDVSE